MQRLARLRWCRRIVPAKRAGWVLPAYDDHADVRERALDLVADIGSDPRVRGRAGEVRAAAPRHECVDPTLRLGEKTVSFGPRGHSMVGKIASGDLCTVAPLGDHVVAVGDIVLCRVKGNQYLHLVKAIQAERFQIGNNRGGINGWIGRAQIHGRLVSVDL